CIIYTICNYSNKRSNKQWNQKFSIGIYVRQWIIQCIPITVKILGTKWILNKVIGSQKPMQFRVVQPPVHMYKNNTGQVFMPRKAPVQYHEVRQNIVTSVRQFHNITPGIKYPFLQNRSQG